MLFRCPTIDFPFVLLLIQPTSFCWSSFKGGRGGRGGLLSCFCCWSLYCGWLLIPVEMCCDWSVILILYHPSLNMISFPPRHSSLFIAVAQSTARSATKWTKNLVPLCLKSYPKIQLSPFLTNPILCPSILLILLCSIYIALLYNFLSFYLISLSFSSVYVLLFLLFYLSSLYLILLSLCSFSYYMTFFYILFLLIIL